jgi:hypothetical protein
MSTEPVAPSDDERLASALAWHAEEMAFYDISRKHARLRRTRVGLAAIVLTGAAPIVVAIDSLPTAAKVAPGAIAAAVALGARARWWRDGR